jgi:hypothetical protein
MPLARAAPPPLARNEPEQRHRLGHALEFMAAALLGHERARDLARCCPPRQGSRGYGTDPSADTPRSREDDFEAPDDGVPVAAPPGTMRWSFCPTEF